jgi:threonine synthase
MPIPELAPPAEPTWLGAGSAQEWPSSDSKLPFVRYRTLAQSYDRAIEAGWTDQQYVDEVTKLDDAVAEVDGTGFRLTSTGSEASLAEAVGHDADLLVKDETGNVAGAHKARHLFGLALHLQLDGLDQSAPLAISSCGNAAMAAATIAAAAGRPLKVFVPTWADGSVLERLYELGAQVQHCERRTDEAGDPCFLRFQESVAAGATSFGCQGPVDPRTLDGGRTLGWEIAEQAANLDRLLIQVGGGALGSSIAQGLWTAAHLGLTDAMPRIDLVQTAGCAPFAAAIGSLGREHPDPAAALAAAASDPDRFMKPWPLEPTSLADGILDDVTYDWVMLAWALMATDGSAIVVDEHLVSEAHRLSSMTGIEASATGTAGLAGILQTPGPAARTLVAFTGVAR